jgi:hypothetical protein
VLTVVGRGGALATAVFSNSLSPRSTAAFSAAERGGPLTTASPALGTTTSVPIERLAGCFDDATLLGAFTTGAVLATDVEAGETGAVEGAGETAAFEGAGERAAGEGAGETAAFEGAGETAAGKAEAGGGGAGSRARPGSAAGTGPAGRLGADEVAGVSADSTGARVSSDGRRSVKAKAHTITAAVVAMISLSLRESSRILRRMILFAGDAFKPGSV